MRGIMLGLALLAAGCSAPVKALSDEGGACTGDEGCRAGLVCKAARCGQPRSRAGLVCVTDDGCAPGLSCRSGHCASGPATPDQCDAACENVRALVLAELRADDSSVRDPGVVPETRAALDRDQRSAAEDIAAECSKTCLASGTIERASCLATAETLAELYACP